MKKILLLTGMAILIMACQNISEKDIQGNWRAFPEGKDSVIYHLNFKNNEVEMIDGYVFKTSGTFEISGNELIITTNSSQDKIKTKIKNFNADTMRLFKDIAYLRDSLFSVSGIDEYELIGIKTKQTLSELDKFYNTIHYFKSTTGKLQKRIGDHVLKTPISYDDFVFCTDHQVRAILFIGKGFNLEDLKEMHHELAFLYGHEIAFVTKRKSFYDYYVFTERISYWYDELCEYSKQKVIPPPPPPPTFLSQKEFLESGANPIEINHPDDLKQLDLLEKNNTYLVSFNSKLDIAIYIKAKIRLKEIKNEKDIKYKTEIM